VFRNTGSEQWMPSIAELIARAQADDHEATEQIILTYQRRVAAMVISIVGIDDDWEDLCQQIFQDGFGIAAAQAGSIFRDLAVQHRAEFLF
jgi:hypothetical protein